MEVVHGGSYHGHKGGVSALAFRPCMRHLVSGGPDGVVLFSSLIACRGSSLPRTHALPIRPYRFTAHQGEIFAVAVSPLDTVVASASKDKTVRLWLPTAEGRSTVIKAHSGAVRTVSFSPDGKKLLTGSDDKTLKVWEMETEKFVTSLSGHVNWVRSADFHFDGRLIASGADDKTIRLWDLEKHECIHQFADGVAGMVRCTKFHPSGSCIASCGEDQCIQIWDIRSKKLVQHYARKFSGVGALSVSFHPSGSFFVSSCHDGSLKLWDLREGRLFKTIRGHNRSTTCVEFSPSGEYLASGSLDEHVFIWRSNMQLSGVYDTHASPHTLSIENSTPMMEESSQDELASKEQLMNRQNTHQEAMLNRECKDLCDEVQCWTSNGKGGPCNEPKCSSLQDDTESDAKRLLMIALKRLVDEMSIITKNISILGERLSHIEDKVLQLEKLHDS